MSTSDILKNIKLSVNTQNTRLLSEAISALHAAEPERWLTLIYLSGGFPEPDNKRFSDALAVILEATRLALENETLEIKAIHHLLVSLIDMKNIFSAITSELEELKVWETPAIKTIFRVAAFLEDQAHISMGQIDQDVSYKGYFDPQSLMENNVSTITGGVNTNRLAAFEEAGENLQLILAYGLYKFKSEFYGESLTPKTPYLDTEFSKLLTLASAWRSYKDLWGNIKYLNWKPVPVDKSHLDVRVYIPSDIQEYIRYRIAGVRMQEYLTENILGKISNKELQDQDFTKEAADSVIFPDQGSVWDGKIAIESFRRAVKQSDKLYEDLLSANGLYYVPLLHDVYLGDKSIEKRVTWELYWHVNKVLRILGDVLSEAAKMQINDQDADSELRRVVVIGIHDLAKIVADTTALPISDCYAAIATSTFHSGFSDLEIWDTPLLMVNDKQVLFIPALVRMGSPVRSAENIIAQWNEHLFDKRGKLLEKRLREFFKHQSGISAQALTFRAGERDIECDLVILWEGFLFLIEAKCTKEVFTAADMYRARGRIEGAIEQLNIRRDAILDNWKSFREAASELPLSEAPITRDRIKLIVATNILHFTGWQERDVVVTDEFCIRRFFGTADIEMVTLSAQGVELLGSIGKIRTKEKPTASEFMIYLRLPPQVEIVRRALDKKTLWLPPVPGLKDRIGMYYIEYNPSKNPLVKSSRMRLKPSDKGKRRRRSKRT